VICNFRWHKAKIKNMIYYSVSASLSTCHGKQISLLL
jgi:hypothetical protein